MNQRNSLKTKIIIICAACTILVGVFSNLFLYYFLTGIISEKAENIDRMNLSTIRNQLSGYLDTLTELGNLCADDFYVVRVLRGQWPGTTEEKKAAIEASDRLNSYLNSKNIKQYVSHLVAFNEWGVNVQPVTREPGSPTAPRQIMESAIFAQLDRLQERDNLRQVVGIFPSLRNGTPCLALLSPAYNVYSATYHGWIYIEMDLEWVRDVLAPFPQENYCVFSEAGLVLSPGGLPEYLQEDPTAYADGETVRQDGRVYRVNKLALAPSGTAIVWVDTFWVYNTADITQLASGGYPVVFTVLVVIATSLIIAILLAFVLSGLITRPLARLKTRLRRISANDFSYDADIEKGSDEIADMGRVVNEMSGSISHLLDETEEMYTQRQNTEIALLQSQINPHFLYNTLDSIRWMATIQKNTGIVNMTRSLSNLLRNLAKGVGDKIPLKEELALLNDYVEIQSIRYVGTFRFDNLVPEEFGECRIVKFTLQPLVENAIFHGIEPTGRFGTVRVEAAQDEEWLLITVWDDGLGMTQSEIEKVLREEPQSAGTLSGIGVANVHKRLRLQYGAPSGLTYESVPGEYTKVTVRIPKER